MQNLKIIILLVTIIICLGNKSATISKKKAVTPVKNPIVTMKTSFGDIEIELFEKQSPVSTRNFLNYVTKGFYRKTIFHRVIDGFMIQGGGFTAQMQEKPTSPPIINEPTNGITNDIGTIAMARTSDVNSATAQFFINVANNTPLNHTSESQAGYGYAVFGKVTKGMPVVNRIKKVKTSDQNGYQDVPVDPIEIIDIVMVKN